MSTADKGLVLTESVPVKGGLMTPLLQIWFHSLLQYSILELYICSNGDSIQNSNVDYIVVWLHATGTWEFGLSLYKIVICQMSNMVFSHHFVLHVLLFSQPYDNTKREARHFGALKKGTKILLAEEKVEKMSMTHFFANRGTFKNSHMSVAWINSKSTFNFESSRRLNIEIFNSRMEYWSKEKN